MSTLQKFPHAATSRQKVCRMVLGTVLFVGLGPLLASNATGQHNRHDRIEDAFGPRMNHRQRPGNRGRHHDPQDPRLDRFRTIDGSYNNPSKPRWGVAGVNLWRLVPSEYSDGVSLPARTDMPSPRAISNSLCDQIQDNPNRRGLTDMVWQWGQFLDHDIDLTESHLPLEEWSINIPAGDRWFDPAGTGAATMAFFRSEYNYATGIVSPREQVNLITAWIDGSNVYGSDEETANQLRLFRNGMLRVSGSEFGHLLPIGDDGFFLAGDIRANEQVYLTSMHTLFMREHNRVCRLLMRANPDLTDEQLYRHARKRVAATIQSITYNEFLPALLGEGALPAYRGYKPNVFPNIANSFSTAAYRFGHSMLNSTLLRLDPNGDEIDAGNLSLAAAFFNPQEIKDLGIDVHLHGLIHQHAQEVDGQLIDDVRNFLFGPPGAGGFDLASLNIQRGRDHGLAGINGIRTRFGLPPFHSFGEMTDDAEVEFKMVELYGDVDNADPWIAMLCEDHFPGASVGTTAFMVIRDQFRRLRDGDRFWYQREFSGQALEAIEATKLSHIIRRNTTIKQIRRDVFTLGN